MKNRLVTLVYNANIWAIRIKIIAWGTFTISFSIFVMHVWWTWVTCLVAAHVVIFGTPTSPSCILPMAWAVFTVLWFDCTVLKNSVEIISISTIFETRLGHIIPKKSFWATVWIFIRIACTFTELVTVIISLRAGGNTVWIFIGIAGTGTKLLTVPISFWAAGNTVWIFIRIAGTVTKLLTVPISVWAVGSCYTLFRILKHTGAILIVVIKVMIFRTVGTVSVFIDILKVTLADTLSQIVTFSSENISRNIKK